MNKEFLNQLKYYLNTNLQLQCTAIFRPKEGSKPSIKGADAALSADIYADMVNGTFSGVGNFRPLVRDLSELQNPIVTADGETIIPMQIFYEMFGGGYNSYSSFVNDNIIGFKMPLINYRHDVIELLLKWHFDVFGWIKSGRANILISHSNQNKKSLPIAVITTTPDKYKLWLKSHSLTGENHIMISKKADMRGRMFSKIELGYDWEKSEQGTVSMAHSRTEEAK